MPVLELGDTRLAYEDWGQGPPVLLIHGFPLTGRLWEPQIKTLVEQGYRVLIPDLRGFGNTPAGSRERGAIVTYVEDLEALLKDLELVRIACVAMSMGGYILMTMIPRRQVQVGAAVFCFTRAGAESEEGIQKRNDLIRQLQIEGPEELARNFAKALLTPERQGDPAWQKRLSRVIGELRIPGMVRALEAMRDRRDSSSWLHEIDCPSLVLYGSEDRIIPAEEARTLARGLPYGRLQELPGVGHLGNLEDPEAFNEALLTFLQEEYPAVQTG